jgi:uncharacterized protein involved in outer membrane biogenesis
VVARVLKVTAGFIAVLALALLIVLVSTPTLDVSAYRDRISTELSSLLDRPVSLEGPIELTVGRNAELRFSKLRIANPAWAAGHTLLEVKDADIAIDLWALTGRVVHIKQMRVTGVDVAAETSSSGENSWTLSASETGTTPSLGWRPVIEEAVVDDVSLIYRDARDESSVSLNLDRIRQHQADGDLVFEGSGALNDVTLWISGQVGTLDAVLAGRDIELAMNASLGRATLDISGSLGRPAEIEDIDLSVVFRSDKLFELTEAFGFEEPLVGNADLLVTIEDQEPGLSWNAVGNLGDHAVQTSGVVESPRKIDGMRMDFDLRGPDLAVFGEAFQIDALPPGAYELSGAVERRAPLLVFESIDLSTAESEVTLNGSLPAFPSISGAAIDFDLVLEDAQFLSRLIEGLPPLSGPLRATADLMSPEEGKTLIDSHVEWEGFGFAVAGELGARPHYVGSELRFESSGPDLGRLISLTEMELDWPKAFVVLGRLEIDEEGRVALQLDRSRIGAAGISAQGSLGRWPELDDADFSVQVYGESLKQALSGLVDRTVPAQSFAMEIAAEGALTSPVLRRLDLKVGDSSLQAKGRIAPVPPHKGTDATFELSVPSLVAWVPELVEESWAARPYVAGGRVRKQGDRIRLEQASVKGVATEWQFDGEINDRFDLASASLRASTKGDDGGQYLPDLTGFEPAKAPFELALDLSASPEHVQIRDLKLLWADSELQGRGQWALSDTASGSAIELELNSSRLSSLGELDALTLPDAPLRLTAKVVPGAGEGFKVPNLAMDVLDGKITGQVSYGATPKPSISADLVATGLDFRPLIRESESSVDTAAAPSTVSSGRVIPDQRISVDVLRRFDAQLRFSGSGLHYPDPGFPGKVLLRDLELAAQLSDGRLDVGRFDAVGDHGDLSIQGMLDGSQAIPELSVKAQTEAFKFGLLASEGGLEALPNNQIGFEVEARGSTVRELAETANGQLRIIGGSGRTANTGLDQKLGSFGFDLLNTVNPFTAREAHTSIDCWSAAFVIEEGVLKMRPGLAVRTDRVDITANGTINLHDERINLNFRNAPRRGLGLSVAGLVRPYVAISGDLARPRLALDTTGALVSGTAAVATGGVSVLLTSLFDRASTATSPCEAVIAAADEVRDVRSLNPLDSLSDSVRRGSTRRAPSGSTFQHDRD